MTLDELSYILDLCDRENIKCLFVQGGEPTTHSKFVEILDMLKRRGFTYKIFTNGIFDAGLIEKMAVESEEEILLLNYNHPDTYLRPEHWGIVNRNLDEMVKKGLKFYLGYNLYEKKPDYKYLLDAIEKYNVKIIRWDLVRPSAKFSNKYFELNEFFEMIPEVAKFIKAYFSAGCSFDTDCPLPVCMMMDKEFDFISFRVDPLKNAYCRTEVNIGPGLAVSTCASSIPFENINLKDFDGIAQAHRFIDYEVRKIQWGVWLLEECNGCIYRILRECQGGCIGHKRKNDRRVAGRKELEEFLRLDKTGAGTGPEQESQEVVAGEIAESIEKYTAAIRNGRSGLYEYYSLGRCYEAINEYDKAIEMYEKASDADRANEVVKNRINFVYQLKAVKRNPGNSNAWVRFRDAVQAVFPLYHETVLSVYEKKFSAGRMPDMPNRQK
jgi:MoaA/NifB/PqqE/SkfB family radical SAM enzyme